MTCTAVPHVGTLALLQETGEAAAVAAAGETWLGSQRRQPGAADVALAVALAQCDLAQAALEGQGDVLAVSSPCRLPAVGTWWWFAAGRVHQCSCGCWF